MFRKENDMELRVDRRWRPPTLDRWQEPTFRRRRTPTLLNSYDLLLLCGLGMLLPLLPGLPVQPGVIAVLRVIVGVPAVLVAPGFAMVAAVFPGRGDLDGPSRAALSFGLSIAAIAVLAVALDLGPWGIRPLPIAVALSLWIGVFGGVAIVRRLRLTSLALDRHPWAPGPVTRREGGQGQWSELRLSRGLATAVLPAAVLAIAAFAGMTVMSIDRAARTTEFYMLGETGQAENYPREAVSGQPLTVTVGLANHERTARTYRIEVWSVDSLNGERQSLLVQGDPIALQTAERHERSIAWRMPVPGIYRVEFRLFLDDAAASRPTAGQDRRAEAYRRLELWVDVAAEQPIAAEQPVAEPAPSE